MLRAFRDVTASAPEELTLWAQLLQFPPLPQVPPFLRGGAFVSVDLTFLGAAEDAERYLTDLRAIPGQVLDTLGTVALADLGDIVAEPLQPMTHQVLSGFLADLDDDTIAAFVKTAGADSGSTLTAVQLRHLGGAFTRAHDADGPVGAISEPYHLFCLGVPQTPAMRAAMATTLAAVAEGLGEHLTGHTHFAFLGDADPSSAFAPSALARLRHSKQEMDPHGVFRSNRPVLAARHVSPDPTVLTLPHDDTVAALAERFSRSIAARDWPALSQVITANATWTFPGENALSGTAVGLDEIAAKAELIGRYGVRIRFEYVLFGASSFIIKLHNTGRRADLVLDEHLATVCTVRDGRIATADTHLSDLDMMNAFFVPLDA